MPDRRPDFPVILLDDSPEAVIVLSRSHEIVFWNRAAEAMFGYDRDEALHRPVSELLLSRTAAEELESFGALLEKDGGPHQIGTIRKDGTPRTVTALVKHISGGFEGILLSLRDVTAAAEASRLRSERLASLSHELRTPLNAIIGFAELMHDGKVGPVASEQKEFLGDILTSSRQLLRLIDDGLDLDDAG